MKAAILLLTVVAVIPSWSTAGTFVIAPYCDAESAEPDVCVAQLVEEWTNRDGMIFYEAGSALSRSFCDHPGLVLEALKSVPSDFDNWVARMPTHTFFIMDHPQSEYGIAATAYLEGLRSCMRKEAESLLDDEEVAAAARVLFNSLMETEIRYVDQT